MEIGSSPASVSSRCRIAYRRSSWSVHQFKFWSGDIVYNVAALRGPGWLLVWVGDEKQLLNELALGMPARSPGATATATALVGCEGAAPALARRLAARLDRPVYVCLGTTFDRFTAPIVEKGLILEIKNRPECF